eukprot:TRINITY_DN2705_c0_g1_i3.p1 TRINITY_DN2705_c0_g1~~TRINITY_DN2705_c0_g1_i3.p1  ORF type:complete len:112 (-),score=4.02 TRINITY_DN2705_c0_g1_i3:271-570(-)
MTTTTKFNWCLLLLFVFVCLCFLYYSRILLLLIIHYCLAKGSFGCCLVPFLTSFNNLSYANSSSEDACLNKLTIVDCTCVFFFSNIFVSLSQSSGSFVR